MRVPLGLLLLLAAVSLHFSRSLSADDAKPAQENAPSIINADAREVAQKLLGNEVAQKLFRDERIDVGILARGSEARHRIHIKNPFKEKIEFGDIRTSASFASATLPKKSLDCLEECVLDVHLDTKRFSQEKSATVVLTIESPIFLEVRIPIKAYIRSDVVPTPGLVDFGSVDRKLGAERKIEIAYAGRNNWQILEAQVGNPDLSATLIPRNRGDGRVNYDLVVKLAPDATPGQIDEAITLVTDDKVSPTFPILVKGTVRSAPKTPADEQPK